MRMDGTVGCSSTDRICVYYFNCNNAQGGGEPTVALFQAIAINIIYRQPDKYFFFFCVPVGMDSLLDL